MGREQELHSCNRELREILDRKNWSRAFASAVFLTLAVPVYLLIIYFSGMYGIHNTPARILLICMEAVQAASAVTGFILISADETDRLKIFYRVYFYITQIFLVLNGRMELAYEGSLFMYGVAAVYGVMLPVYISTERNLFHGLSAFLCVVTAASAVGMGRSFVETVLMSLGLFLIGRYISDNSVSHENLAMKLRAKIITSEKDPLTSLMNRRGVDKKMSYVWNTSERDGRMVGAIEIDIDFFKKYNDKFGHPAGDRCLKMISSAIKKAAGDAEIIARIGGEEFLVILDCVRREEVINTAMNIRKAVGDLAIPHACVSVSGNVTVSMGAAVITPDEYNSFEELYDNVDEALYAAKNNGRNCIVCDNRIYGRMKNGLATVISI